MKSAGQNINGGLLTCPEFVGKPKYNHYKLFNNNQCKAKHCCYSFVFCKLVFVLDELGGHLDLCLKLYFYFGTVSMSFYIPINSSAIYVHRVFFLNFWWTIFAYEEYLLNR